MKSRTYESPTQAAARTGLSVQDWLRRPVPTLGVRPECDSRVPRNMHAAREIQGTCVLGGAKARWTQARNYRSAAEVAVTVRTA